MQKFSLPSSRTPGRRTSDEVHASLIEAIATGQLRAGDRLPSEDQLAAHFDVAIMTLRHALAQLREQGYVVTKRGRNGGTRVADDVAERFEANSHDYDISVNDLRILTDWRRAVSGEATYLAALRGTETEHRELILLCDEYREMLGDTPKRRLADARFHVHIAQMSGNPQLVEAEREIQEQLTRFIRVTPFKGLVIADTDIEHDGIVDAIIAGDAEAARDALLDHVEVTYYWGSKHPGFIGHIPPTPEELAGPISVRAKAATVDLHTRPQPRD